VTNLLRLLELEPETKKLLDEGLIEMGHARALLALRGGEQVAAANYVVNKSLSVRETERYIKRLGEQKNPQSAPDSRKKSPDVQRLESDLADRLGAPVSISYDAKGKGKLVVSYSNLDELDGILAHFSKASH